MDVSSGLKPNEGAQVELPGQPPLAEIPLPGDPRLDSASASASGVSEAEKLVTILAPQKPRGPAKKTVHFPDDVDEPAAQVREERLLNRTSRAHPLVRIELQLQGHVPESKSDRKDDADRPREGADKPDDKASGRVASDPKPREVEPIKEMARKLKNAIVRESMTPDQAQEKLDRLGLGPDARETCKKERDRLLLGAAKRDEDTRWTLLGQGHLTFKSVAQIRKLDPNDCQAGLFPDPDRLTELRQLVLDGLLDQRTYDQAADYVAHLIARRAYREKVKNRG